MLIGVIADDFTGATDVALAFANAGLSAVQVNGVPPAEMGVAADAIVVALKSRTAPVDEAVAQSRAAHAWLSARGAPRILFKVCSTFDSTPAGNIGPVADALLDATGAGVNVVTPAYPRNARTVYLGYLFVGNVPLAESSMRTHPLTPMADSNLVRVLAAQTPRRVALVAQPVVERGAAAIAAEIARLAAEGAAHLIVDATTQAHIESLGQAVRDLPLTTAAAGLATGLALALRTPGATARSTFSFAGERGRAAVLAGSCSAATLQQLAALGKDWPQVRLDPLVLAHEPQAVDHAIERALAVLRSNGKPVVVAASDTPGRVQAAQQALGRGRAAELIEEAFRRFAVALAQAGVRRFVVAGGETSGAVVEALGIHSLAIGPEIAPGVPWTRALDGTPHFLALKSGNFGGEDFFRRAFDALG